MTKCPFCECRIIARCGCRPDCVMRLCLACQYVDHVYKFTGEVDMKLSCDTEDHGHPIHVIGQRG